MIEPARDARPAGLPLPEVPVAFDGLFGWFAPGIGCRGVVLCGTLGLEQLRAHRSWRTLARAVAGTGCATLRFDYPGQGDSGDGDSGDGGSGDGDSGDDGVRLADLVAAIGRAVRFLREAAGVTEVVLVGLRLGATLTAEAARAGGIDRLVLLAPFPTGRAYLREMALQARTLDRLPDGTPLPREDGVVSAGGFRIGPALAADLTRLDITAAGRPPVPEILVVGPPAGVAAAYAAHGRVETAPFPGLARLVAAPRHDGVDADAFAAIVAFAADGLRPRPGPIPAVPAPDPIAGPGWVEEPVRFGRGLFGIVCGPPGPAPGGRAVLFLNTGSDVHSGYGRQTTTIARTLAAAGTPSLRMDQRGIGDSAGREDGTTPLYALDAVADARAAVDLLVARGAEAVVAVGTCSGAHLAFHALCADARLPAAVLVNLYRFDWDPEADIDAALANMFRSTASYASILRRGSAWGRILRGEVRVAAILARLLKAQRDRLRGRLRRLLPGGRAASVAGRVAALRARGARLHLVYGAGEMGLDEVRAQLGRPSPRLTRRLGSPLVVLEGADHSLSTRTAQARLCAILRAVAASPE